MNPGRRITDATSHAHRRDDVDPALVIGPETVLGEADPPPVHEGGIAVLQYTSGTTGRPKGATLTHRNLLMASLSYFADIDQVMPEDGILHAAPLSHGSGLYGLPHVARGAVSVVPHSGGVDGDEIAVALDEAADFDGRRAVVRCRQRPRAAASAVSPVTEPTTTPVATRLRTRLATTWPVSTAQPRIGIVRNRSMIPVVMSWLTLTAVPAAPNPAQSRMMPGTT